MEFWGEVRGRGLEFLSTGIAEKIRVNRKFVLIIILQKACTYLRIYHGKVQSYRGDAGEFETNYSFHIFVL